MKILMLCPLISSSSFITTYPLATILSKKHDVVIVGPLFGKEPYIRDAGLSFEFIEPAVRHPLQLGFMSLIRKNKARLMKGDFDVVHAFKLLPHTGPVAASAAAALGKKFVLSLDDYDVASPRNPLKRWILRQGEQAYRQADAVTVSSRYLQTIYGGDIIYQVANENLFSHYIGNGKTARRALGLTGEIIILYAGTMFPHKGVDLLMTAVQRLNNPRVRLVLIGDAPPELRKRAGPETIIVGPRPMEQIPDYVAACDIYAIPTRDTAYARAEIPAKIFEPMMMGKAIVATRLSDIPLILDHGRCGLLAEPDDVTSLANGLQTLIADDRLRKTFGRAAKKRFFNQYDANHTEQRLKRIYDRLVA